MTNIKLKKKFYAETSSWRVPALLGLIVFFLSLALRHNFYYLHLYLITAGLISYIISYRKYAILTNSALHLYVGILGKCVSINFDKISTVEIETKDVESYARIGPMGGVRHNFPIFFVSINLLEPLDEVYQDLINGKKSKNIFLRKMEVTENGSKIILYKAPRGGFRPLMDSLSKSAKALHQEAIPYEGKFADLKAAVLSVLLFAGYIILAFVAITRN